MSKKHLAAAPPPPRLAVDLDQPDEEQPIPAATLKQFWLDHLENRNIRLDLIDRTNAVGRLENELNNRIEAAFRHAGVNRTEWDMSFKLGTMTRKPTA
jgi:hypothetical protein